MLDVTDGLVSDWENGQILANCVGKSLHRSNPFFCLLSSYSTLSYLSSYISSLWCLVWLHEQVAEKLSVTDSSSVSSISFFFLSVFCASLPASVLWLDSALFHLLTNTGTSVYLGLFSVDVCISNFLCGLTCFHQRCWHWFNPLTPTISHPSSGSMPLYQSDE